MLGLTIGGIAFIMGIVICICEKSWDCIICLALGITCLGCFISGLNDIRDIQIIKKVYEKANVWKSDSYYIVETTKTAKVVDILRCVRTFNDDGETISFR